MITTKFCDGCAKEIKGCFTHDEGKPIHVRCLRKRIESSPGFAGWISRTSFVDPAKVQAVF